MSRSRVRRFADFIRFVNTDYDNDEVSISGVASTTEVEAAIQPNTSTTLTDLTVTGTVSANSYSGDGTGLTGLAKEATVSTSAPSGGSDGDVWYQVS